MKKIVKVHILQTCFTYTTGKTMWGHYNIVGQTEDGESYMYDPPYSQEGVAKEVAELLLGTVMEPGKWYKTSL